MQDLLSLYLHIPFCQKRCGYCDFVTFAGMENYLDPYIKALCAEIIWYGKHLAADKQIHTIYIGGGTPSILNPDQVGAIMKEVERALPCLGEIEVTIEANPGTLSRDKLDGYLSAGINRISLGMQSARNKELKLLDRIHDFSHVNKAIEDANSSGFKNISVDLIYGLPGQKISDWMETLDAVLSLRVQHISCYSLTIEDGTPLAKQVAEGNVTPLDNDLVGDMFEAADQFLEKNNFEHYEISNWAELSGHYRSKHNLQYWLNEPYLGLGVGAHGYLDGLRIVNTHNIIDYIQRIQTISDENSKSSVSPAALETERIGSSEKMRDEMMLGFRLLKDGIQVSRYIKKYGIHPEKIFQKELSKLIANGLVTHELNPEKYVLTKRGMMVANQVFLEFVDET